MKRRSLLRSVAVAIPVGLAGCGSDDGGGDGSGDGNAAALTVEGGKYAADDEGHFQYVLTVRNDGDEPARGTVRLTGTINGAAIEKERRVELDPGETETVAFGFDVTEENVTDFSGDVRILDAD